MPSKHNPRFNFKRAAQVLIDAHFTTDAEAARKWGIHWSTVSDYRRRLRESEKDHHPELLAHYLILLAEVRASPEWDWLGDAMRSFVRAAIECAQSVNRADPASIQAIAHAIEVVGNYELTKTVIDQELHAATHAAATPQAYAGAGAQGATPVRAFA